VQFCGSSVACGSSGSSYSASIFCAAAANAAFASPSSRATLASALRVASAFASPAEIVALLTLAPGPKSHSMSSASRACRACHHESASTTTPLLVGTTWRTPGMARVRSSVNVRILPPSTGHCASAPNSMFGKR
jgi:hypothetical protein